MRRITKLHQFPISQNYVNDLLDEISLASGYSNLGIGTLRLLSEEIFNVIIST